MMENLEAVAEAMTWLGILSSGTYGCDFIELFSIDYTSNS